MNQRVLIVDDDLIARKTLTSLFEKLNFSVTTVPGGKEALQLFNNGQVMYDLLLVDVMMPEISGIELLKIFKKAYNYDIPIIMISSSEDENVISESFSSGAEDFLQKPIQFEMLKRRIAICLEEKSRKKRETMLKQQLQQVEETRSILSKQVQEQEIELKNMKTKLADTIETPMQVVMKTINDLMRGDYTADQYRSSLFAIQKSLGSRDLYRPSFAAPKDSETVDDATKKWLLNEYLSETKQQQEQKEMLQNDPNRKNSLDMMLTASAAAAAAASHSHRNSISPQMIPNFDKFTFDVFEYSADQLLNMVAYIFEQLGLVEQFRIDTKKLNNFLKKLKENYYSNPYHNIVHALDVTQFIYACLKIDRVSSILTPIEMLAILLSALCHDLKHPGLNNNYQINAKTELSILYNDISVLENHHCSVAFSILKEENCNFLEHLTPMDFKELRRVMISAILATDMAQHFEIASKFSTRIQAGPISKESKDDRQQLINILLKCADISNPARPFDVAKSWADCLVNEFLFQGDMEKQMGMPISPNMDRNTLSKPKLQISFIDFIVGPLFKSVSEFITEMRGLYETLMLNREKWNQYLASVTASATATPTSANNGTKLELKQELKQESKQEQKQELKQEQKDVLFVGHIDDYDVTKIKGFKLALITQKDAFREELEQFCDTMGLYRESFSTVKECITHLSNQSSSIDVFVMDTAEEETLLNLRKLIQNTTKVPFIVLNDKEKQLQIEYVHYMRQHSIPILDFYNLLEQCIEESLLNSQAVDLIAGSDLCSCDGDLEFFFSLLEDLQTDGSSQLEKIRNYTNGTWAMNWDDLQLQAHSIKGAASQLAAKPIAQAAFAIEKAAKNREPNDLKSLLKVLEERFEAFTLFIHNR